MTPFCAQRVFAAPKFTKVFVAVSFCCKFAFTPRTAGASPRPPPTAPSLHTAAASHGARPLARPVARQEPQEGGGQGQGAVGVQQGAHARASPRAVRRRSSAGNRRRPANVPMRAAAARAWRPPRRRAAPEASASPLCCLAELRPSPRLALARVASTPITAIDGAVRSWGARSEAPRAAFLFAAARRGFGV